MPFLVAEGSAQPSSAPLLIPLLALLLMCAFMMWNAHRRNKAHQQAQASLQVGQTVRTTSGMFGVLTELTDQTGSLEVADGVRITFDRRALLPADDAVRAAGTATEAEDGV